jgi:hypothetical protein
VHIHGGQLHLNLAFFFYTGQRHQDPNPTAGPLQGGTSTPPRGICWRSFVEGPQSCWIALVLRVVRDEGGGGGGQRWAFIGEDTRDRSACSGGGAGSGGGFALALLVVGVGRARP